MRYCFSNLRNCFDFFLRNRIVFSRKNYTEPVFDAKNISLSEEQICLYELLKQKYDTSVLEKTTQYNFLQNLYCLNLFDKYLSVNSKKNISVLDIGSKNWSYVLSEYLFFNSISENVELNGIELDGYRLCTNLYSRYEIAKFYIKNLKNTDYIIGDFLNHNKKYDYIVWFLPFITEYPLIKWGLPLKYFKPEEMLIHAYKLLNTGGELIVLNQGEDEYKIQRELYSKLNLSYFDIGAIEDVFKAFKNKRFCSVVKKG